ncbi:unnamed protein product [Euphydryas editha]|uniref:Uncharacterized protein n=1 Tax=Euphydryas editha TaxID=104508 RepID=A0AAU9VBI2_EUPED|nr:unnamed protein product [Euphydryas editha]
MESIKESLISLAELFNSRMNDFQQNLQETCSQITTYSIVMNFAAFRSFIISAVNTLQRQCRADADRPRETTSISRNKFLICLIKILHEVHVRWETY